MNYSNATNKNKHFQEDDEGLIIHSVSFYPDNLITQTIFSFPFAIDVVVIPDLDEDGGGDSDHRSKSISIFWFMYFYFCVYSMN